MTKFAYTIVFVSDMARSVAFYRDLIGVPLKFESPDWSEFSTAGCTLALHKSAGGILPPGPPNEDTRTVALLRLGQYRRQPVLKLHLPACGRRH